MRCDAASWPAAVPIIELGAVCALRTDCCLAAFGLTVLAIGAGEVSVVSDKRPMSRRPLLVGSAPSCVPKGIEDCTIG